MKKFLTMLFALVLTFSLASCGDNSSSSSKNESSNTDGNLITGLVLDTSLPEINISFWHTMGKDTKPELTSGISAFQKEYPNIKVTETYIDGGYDGLKDKIQSGINNKIYPNIAYCYADHVASYNDADVVQTLDKYIDDANVGFNAKDKQDFYPGFYAEGKAFGDDHMYVLPFAKSTEVLYYNKDVFTAKGYTVPATWDQTWTLAQTMKDDYVASENDDVSLIPLGYDSGANWFITHTEQVKSGYTSIVDRKGQYNFNNDANVEFVKTLRAYYQKGLLSTKEINSGSNLNVSLTNPRVYMSIGSSGGAKYQLSQNFEVGVAPAPQTDLDNKKVISQGPDIVMLKSPNKDANMAEQEQIASWLFMKYLTNTTFQSAFSQNTAYMPVRKSVSDLPEYINFLAKADDEVQTADSLKAQVLKVALAQADNYFVSPAFNGSSNCRLEMETLMTQGISKGDIEVQKIFDDAMSNLAIFN